MQLVAEFQQGQRSRSDPRDLIEIVDGREAVNQRAQQIQMSATEEVIAMSKPPYAGRTRINDAERAALPRGILFRFIYDEDALAAPGHLDAIKEDVRSGEEARVIAELPLKLVVADRVIGLVPLTVDQPHVEAALLLHASSLLDAFVMLFESLWDQAVPLRFNDTTSVEDQQNSSGVDVEVLSLAVAGLGDDAIAARLNVSVRTVHRRIRQMMTELGARTRLQMGFLASKRGWL
jgi:DNA-binding CsgD family transcriptional regulator